MFPPCQYLASITGLFGQEETKIPTHIPSLCELYDVCDILSKPMATCIKGCRWSTHTHETVYACTHESQTTIHFEPNNAFELKCRANRLGRVSELNGSLVGL